ncbi:MAG: hypothetical protein H0Z31_12225 [Bacillus sp. (in: Bacteria)]|nr:hypothetical protein [Bacillus sp. (in: firmicutes)]
MLQLFCLIDVFLRLVLSDESGKKGAANGSVQLGTADLALEFNKGIKVGAKAAIVKYNVNKDFTFNGITFETGFEAALGSYGAELNLEKKTGGFIGLGPAGLGVYIKVK